MPLFDIMPENDAPAAVVRRRGESRDQMQLRHQGYSDEQMGFEGGVSYGRGNGASGALARAHGLSLREDAMAAQQARFEAEHSVATGNLGLRQKEYERTLAKDMEAQQEEHTKLDHVAKFDWEINELAKRVPRATPQFYNEALNIASKYPVLSSHPRTMKQLQYYEEQLGQMAKLTPVENAQAMTPALVERQIALEGAKTPKPEKDTILPGLEKDRSLAARELDKAKTRREAAARAIMAAEKAGDEESKHAAADIAKAADADILEWQPRLTDAESQLRAHRAGNVAPATHPAPSEAAIKLLISKPELKDKFEAVHGPGSSAQYLSPTQ